MKTNQLKQIVKEEYQKLLKEEVSQFLIDSFIEGVKDAFGKESNLYATKGDEYEKLKTAAEEVIASTDSGDVTVEELIDASQLYAFGLKENRLLKEGEDYHDHYKNDLIFKVRDKHEAFDLYKKSYKYGFVSDHYFDNDTRYGNTTGSDIIVFPDSVNDLPNSAGKLIKIIGKEPITIEGWEDIVTESVNEAGVDISLGIGVMDKVKELYQNKDIQGLKDFRQRFDYPKASMKVKKLVPKLISDLENKESVNEMHDRQLPDVEQWEDDKKTTMKRSELKKFIKEIYLKTVEEEDKGEDDVDEFEADFDEEPAEPQGGESRAQEEAPRKRINFENRELEMLVDVNRNPTKRGVKIQFLSDDELSKEERTKLVSALQVYLDEGLAEFVKGPKLNVDSDPDVPNKTKTVGFTIKIGDIFGLVSSVFSNRGDDEEGGEGEEGFEAETEEAPEELNENISDVRKYLYDYARELYSKEEPDRWKEQILELAKELAMQAQSLRSMAARG